MDYLFVIPTLISPNVDDKLVPALCKLVERNIILSYRTFFIDAVKRIYLGPYRGLEDSFDPLLEIERITKEVEEFQLLKEQDEDEGPRGRGRRPAGGGSPRGRGRGEAEETRGAVQKAEDVEIATGISFYRTISLEPTFLEFNLRGRPKADSPPGDEITRMFRIGMKCVPYKLDGVNNLKSALTVSKNRSHAMTWFSRVSNRLFGGIISAYRRMRSRGEKRTPVDMFKVSPTASELSNVKKLSRMMGGAGTTTQWSPLVIFSRADFEDKEYRENIWEYRQIVRGGWGDMIVIDDQAEMVNFCMQRDKACYQLGYTYLRQILNLDDVIDAGLYGTTSRGFGQIGSGRTSLGPQVQDAGKKVSTGDIAGGSRW